MNGNLVGFIFPCMFSCQAAYNISLLKKEKGCYFIYWDYVCVHKTGWVDWKRGCTNIIKLNGSVILVLCICILGLIAAMALVLEKQVQVGLKMLIFLNHEYRETMGGFKKNLKVNKCNKLVEPPVHSHINCEISLGHLAASNRKHFQSVLKSHWILKPPSSF